VVSNLHLVMHGVAIKKHCTAADISVLIGLPTDLVERELVSANKGGRVVLADGKYMLSAAGQMILLGEYSRFYEDLRADSRFTGAYDRFEIINTDLKQLITEWQTVEIAGKRVANDHSNAEYDDKLIGRLGDLHERFEPILTSMTSSSPRLECYALEWVSDAKIESYHTVWFEMHEDLLRLLGRLREE
jgi:hypothetical protein